MKKVVTHFWDNFYVNVFTNKMGTELANYSKHNFSMVPNHAKEQELKHWQCLSALLKCHTLVKGGKLAINIEKGFFIKDMLICKNLSIYLATIVVVSQSALHCCFKWSNWEIICWMSFSGSWILICSIHSNLTYAWR